MGKVNHWIRKLLIFLIQMYQVGLSPLLGHNCRFYPTCSNYALTTIRKYGPYRGIYFSIRRLLRCNPWCKSGLDDVPFLLHKPKTSDQF